MAAADPILSMSQYLTNVNLHNLYFFQENWHVLHNVFLINYIDM